ncbi:MAG: hypothetical protein FJ242_07750 [Nitrospira sp.]|nr:hypothetical protein [Nitrospira sp.]
MNKMRKLEKRQIMKLAWLLLPVIILVLLWLVPPMKWLTKLWVSFSSALFTLGKIFIWFVVIPAVIIVIFILKMKKKKNNHI